MATTVLLVRHASHPLLGKVLCGRMPGVDLDEAGHRQARHLGEFLARQRPDVLLTSPLSRARATAAAIAEASGLSPQSDAAFDEIDFGAWTGLRFTDLEEDTAWSRWNSERAEARPPCGEPMHQAQGRIVAGLTRMQAEHPDGTIVAVSHADIIKSALLWCLGLTLDAHMRFDIDPASVSAIALWEGGGKVLCMNQGVTA